MEDQKLLFKGTHTLLLPSQKTRNIIKYKPTKSKKGKGDNKQKVTILESGQRNGRGSPISSASRGWELKDLHCRTWERLRKWSHWKDSIVCFVVAASIGNTFDWQHERGVVKVQSSGHVNCGTQVTQGPRNSMCLPPWGLLKWKSLHGEDQGYT